MVYLVSKLYSACNLNIGTFKLVCIFNAGKPNLVGKIYKGELYIASMIYEASIL